MYNNFIDGIILVSVSARIASPFLSLGFFTYHFIWNTLFFHLLQCFPMASSLWISRSLLIYHLLYTFADYPSPPSKGAVITPLNALHCPPTLVLYLSPCIIAFRNVSTICNDCIYFFVHLFSVSLIRVWSAWGQEHICHYSCVSSWHTVDTQQIHGK